MYTQLFSELCIHLGLGPTSVSSLGQHLKNTVRVLIKGKLGVSLWTKVCFQGCHRIYFIPIEWQRLKKWIFLVSTTTHFLGLAHIELHGPILSRLRKWTSVEQLSQVWLSFTRAMSSADLTSTGLALCRVILFVWIETMMGGNTVRKGGVALTVIFSLFHVCVWIGVQQWRVYEDVQRRHGTTPQRERYFWTCSLTHTHTHTHTYPVGAKIYIAEHCFGQVFSRARL